jgi:hypothetical protein
LRSTSLAILFRRQVEERQRLVHALATDLVGEQPRLARAHPVVLEEGIRAHGYFVFTRFPPA